MWKIFIYICFFFFIHFTLVYRGRRDMHAMRMQKVFQNANIDATQIWENVVVQIQKHFIWRRYRRLYYNLQRNAHASSSADWKTKCKYDWKWNGKRDIPTTVAQRPHYRQFICEQAKIGHIGVENRFPIDAKTVSIFHLLFEQCMYLLLMLPHEWRWFATTAASKATPHTHTHTHNNPQQRKNGIVE